MARNPRTNDELPHIPHTNGVVKGEMGKIRPFRNCFFPILRKLNAIARLSRSFLPSSPFFLPFTRWSIDIGRTWKTAWLHAFLPPFPPSETTPRSFTPPRTRGRCSLLARRLLSRRVEMYRCLNGSL